MNQRYLGRLLITVFISGLMTSNTALPQGLFIRDVVVVSVEDDNPSELTNVVVQDGRIAAIGNGITPEDWNINTVLEGNGRYLSPGLIDGHTHLAEVPGMRPDHELSFPNVAAAARQQIPRSYLYHGFTTVVDLNSRAVSIQRWNGQEIRPTAYFCGAAPVFDGYPMRFMPKPLRYQITPYFLYDEARAGEFPDEFDIAEHTPAAIVKKIKADGGICVKTHHESGFGGSGQWPVPANDLIVSLVEEAHQLGMPVLLHANSQNAQRFGVETSVDAIVHGIWTWNDRGATDLNADISDILDRIVDERVGWQATIQVLYGERDLHNPDYLSQEPLKNVLPDSLIRWYQTEDGQWWRNRMRKTPGVKQQIESEGWQSLDAAAIERVSIALNYLAKNDARLLFGSDTPSDPTYANPPGLTGRLEIQRWADAGVSPIQIFRAATLSNAIFFGIQNDIGTIEVGKRADMLVLGSNPLRAVSAYDEIDLIILEGQIIPRIELAARRLAKK